MVCQAWSGQNRVSIRLKWQGIVERAIQRIRVVAGLLVCGEPAVRCDQLVRLLLDPWLGDDSDVL